VTKQSTIAVLVHRYWRGLGTYLQTFCTQSQVPVYLRSVSWVVALTPSRCCSLLFTSWYGYVTVEAMIFEDPPISADTHAGCV